MPESPVPRFRGVNLLRRVILISSALLQVFVATVAFGQPHFDRSVLLIGNSMIGPTKVHLTRLSASAGESWRIKGATRGGARLESFTNGDDPRAIDEIDRKVWDDVVFVQGTIYWFDGTRDDVSNLAAGEAVRRQIANSTINAAEVLHRRIQSADARTVIYMSYPHQLESGHVVESFEPLERIHWELHDRLSRQTDDATPRPLLVPVGVLWLHGAKEFGSDAWYKDNLHGSNAAYYANACLFYAFLTDRDPRPIAYDGGLPPEQARWVREKAWSLHQTYRRPIASE